MSFLDTLDYLAEDFLRQLVLWNVELALLTFYWVFMVENRSALLEFFLTTSLIDFPFFLMFFEVPACGVGNRFSGMT